MSKLNLSIATALAAAAVATVSVAQIPPVRGDSQNDVAIQQRDPAARPSASASQTSHESPAPEAADPRPVQTGASAPAVTAPAPSVRAVEPGFAPAPAQMTRPNSEPPGGEVSASGQVLIASEPATPGKTYTYRFTATADVANIVWRSGRGYDLFSDRDAAWRLGVGFGYDVLRFPENLVLAVEAGFLHEPTHGSNLTPLFGNLSGSLSASTVQLGPSLRWDIAHWFAPYGRLGVLATSFSMDLEAGATSWSYQKWAGGALLGAGVMVTLPPRSPVNVGALVEGGYWLQRDVPIQLERDLPRDAIATSSARIGTLENSGPYLRIAGVLRF